MDTLEAEEMGLMLDIIKLAGHDKLGQSTYVMGGCKVTIKTSENITLDKAKLNVVWNEDLPINRSYAYTLRSKDYAAMMRHGKAADRKLLSDIVSTKPARPVVRVEA